MPGKVWQRENTTSPEENHACSCVRVRGKPVTITAYRSQSLAACFLDHCSGLWIEGEGILKCNRFGQVQ